MRQPTNDRKNLDQYLNSNDAYMQGIAYSKCFASNQFEPSSTNPLTPDHQQKNIPRAITASVTNYARQKLEIQ